jgi:hypothetical protein
MAEVAKTFSVTSRGVGLPDYSVAKPVGQVPIGPIYTTTDVGELAVRLGSPVSFDRRGNVFWYDDFENGLTNKWRPTPIPGLVSLSTEYCYHGSKSCKLITNNWVGSSSYVLVYLAYPSITKLGFSLAFSLPRNSTYAPDGVDCKVEFLVRVYSGSNEETYKIRYSNDTGNLEYYSEAGAYMPFEYNVPLQGIDYITGNGIPIFHVAKVVIDSQNSKYTRFIIDGLEYNLSSYAPLIVPDTTPPLLSFTYYLTTASAAVARSHIDSFIATQNEPVNT